MPTTNQTVLHFDFGIATYAIAGFGGSGTISANDTALFSAFGLNFTYSSNASNSNFDTGNSGMLNVRGTDTLALSTGNASHIFSNATLDFGIVYGNASISFLNSTGSVVAQFTNSDINPSGSLHFAGEFTSIQFKSSLLMNIDTVTMSVNCFLTGTRILTPTGYKAVETLAQGDLITTAAGGTTVLKWRGEQKIASAFKNPDDVNPICIRANALGLGYPEQDFYLTSDHALGIDGQLINAACLINNDTIYRVPGLLGNFVYHHLETENHELIVAEGVPVESFIDYAGYDGFEIIDDRRDHPPIREMPLPRISAKRLVDPDLTLVLDYGHQIAA